MNVYGTNGGSGRMATWDRVPSFAIVRHISIGWTNIDVLMRSYHVTLPQGVLSTGRRTQRPVLVQPYDTKKQGWGSTDLSPSED